MPLSLVVFIYTNCAQLFMRRAVMINTFSIAEIPLYSSLIVEEVTTKEIDVEQNTLVMTRFSSPVKDFAELIAVASHKGLCLLEYSDTGRVERQLASLKKYHTATLVAGNSPFFASLNQQLHAYFAGTLTHFTVPLDIRGTAFQMQAWNALLTIPYGETRSYQQQAEAINNPKAVRAVANANRNNRVSIIIPCHRVIGKNGTMTGYGGGIWRKEYLLNLEVSA
jgi:O-6-methylguanine DNA methyltransferase